MKSLNIYLELGFREVIISEKMSYFHIDKFGFYLQDYYAKDWINKSMVFLEVDNLISTFENIKKLGLINKYKNVRLSEIKKDTWGNEFFLHDSSGIPWHIGEFI